MKRFAVEVLPEAEQEFRAAFRWYFQRSPIAADAFRAEVVKAIDALANNAEVWPANDAGFQFRLLDRFPYTIWYDVLGQTATVLAVAHQHRRPNYWKSRG